MRNASGYLSSSVRAERHADARRRDADRSVARHRVDEIRGDERRGIPVAGVVLHGAEGEVAHGGDPHADSGAGARRRRRASARRARISALVAACPAAERVGRGLDRVAPTPCRDRAGRGGAGAVNPPRPPARCAASASAASNRASRVTRAGSAAGRGVRGAGAPLSLPCRRTRSMSTTTALRPAPQVDALGGSRGLQGVERLLHEGNCLPGSPTSSSPDALHIALYASRSGRFVATSGVSSWFPSSAVPTAALVARSAAASTRVGVRGAVEPVVERVAFLAGVLAEPREDDLAHALSQPGSGRPRCCATRRRAPAREIRGRFCSSACAIIRSIRWLSAFFSASAGGGGVDRDRVVLVGARDAQGARVGAPDAGPGDVVAIARDRAEMQHVARPQAERVERERRREFAGTRCERRGAEHARLEREVLAAAGAHDELERAAPRGRNRRARWPRA